MKKVNKIICLEIFFVVVSLLIYCVHPLINPTMNLFISNLGVIWYVSFLIFLLVFGIVYTAKKKEPQLLFINIFLFIIYLILPFVISYFFFSRG